MGKRENRALREIIVSMRDKEQLTFQEISDELKSRYGVTRTRQAISAIYTRTKNSINSQSDEERLRADIINLYCLLDSATDVYNQLGKQDINYRYVLRVINSDGAYIDSVKTTIVANMVSQLSVGVTNLRELMHIEYKNVKISDKRFNEYLELACEHLIRQNIIARLSQIHSLTNNRHLVKEVGNKFNVNITMSELREQ